jgi:hypothetical protein
MLICDACGFESGPENQFCGNPSCRRYLGWQIRTTLTGSGPRSKSMQVEVRRRAPVEGTPPALGDPVAIRSEVAEVSHRLVRQRSVPIAVAARVEAPPPPGQSPHLVSDGAQGLLLSLDVGQIHVHPGREVVITAEVHNKGTIVDSVDLAVQGIPQDWVTVRPPTVNLYVDAKASFRIHVAPPLHCASRPGPVSAQVAVWSATNPKVRCTQRLAMTVAPFGDVDAQFDRFSQVARRRATYVMTLINGGNRAVQASVGGADKEGAVAVRCQPSRVAVEAGGQARVMIVATPSPLLKGSSVRHQLEISLSTGQHVRQLPLTLEQAPLFSKWVVRLAVTALAVMMAGVLLAWRSAHKHRPVAVPNVVGQPAPAAEQHLKGAHLNPQVVQAANGEGQAGTVSNENPPGGTYQKRGSTIVITVSPGPAPVPQRSGGSAPGASQK